MATTLARRGPFTGISGFRGFLDPLFGDIESQLGFEHRWMPAIDVIRGDDEVTVRADVPGIKPEDVKIEVENDTLTISGRTEQESEEKDDNYLRRERRIGYFSRSITLPPNTDRAAIDAVVKDGVCSVTIPLPSSEDEKIKITPKAG